mgnify:CR=1 FL=1
MIMGKAKKIFVGMSGGVDSSVAAYLLKKQGHDLVGVYLRGFNVDGCAEKDAEDARRVAEHLKIQFYVWDFEKEYKERVVEYMVEAYRIGLTPNPDVVCNRELKFGLFLERALKMGADFVATGHYVQIKKSKIKNQNFNILKIAKDKNKDQSYFLWTLTQKQLAHALFPLGNLEKPEVRKIAEKAGLPTAKKKDSQGICFLGMVSMEEFLKTRLPVKKGDVFTEAGEKLGEHQGAHFYTIGQRHGLNLSAKQIKGGEVPAHYVVSKDVRTNTIVVAEGANNESLFKKEISLVSLNLAVPFKIKKAIHVMARVRYRQPLSAAKLTLQSGNIARLIFDESQKFVAAGQSCVFYDASGCLLGGAIVASSK